MADETTDDSASGALGALEHIAVCSRLHAAHPLLGVMALAGRGARLLPWLSISAALLW